MIVVAVDRLDHHHVSDNDEITSIGSGGRRVGTGKLIVLSDMKRLLTPTIPQTPTPGDSPSNSDAPK